VIAAFSCANCILELSTPAQTDKDGWYCQKIFAESLD
jgi:hypothetical protein